MRILSISGQNIASLAQPFTVDFTAEPLASAGLFAITGETGAGKSSILDAMCLALYGDAPRLAGSSSDEVPDPSGKPIKARDARAILRRGAAQGWAEVRFTARDGQDYIARWQARRARDKVDGPFQNVSRSLARASDGQMLANQLSAVTEQISALTGFSYEEFRRTVLLAQGDFDAFLRADTNDRAGLLEKVTGTGLYRAVSSRIYERHEASRLTHDALSQRRAAYQLLSDADLDALRAERQMILQSALEAAAKAEAVKAQLDRHNRHAKTTHQLALTEAEETQAIARQAAATPQRERLARIDGAGPLRAPWQAMQDAEARLAAATSAVETTATAAREAETKATALKDQTSRAETQLAKREAEFKALGPIWDQAAALDTGITAAKAELEGARSLATALEQKAVELRQALTTLQADESTHRDAMTRADTSLATMTADLALTDDWPQINARLDAHAGAQKAFAIAETDAQKHGVDLAQHQQELTDLAGRANRDSQAEVVLVQKSTDLTTALATLEASHPPHRNGDLSDLSAALAEMIRAEAEHSTASAELTAANASDLAALTLAAVAQTQATTAEGNLLRAEAQVAALTAPSQQADLAASETARDLRLRLEPDTPCPVCGSTDHPAHADAALASLAANLRADLAAARLAAQTARTQQAEALRQQDRAQSQARQAKTDAARAIDRRVAALDLWQVAGQRAATFPDCPALPVHPGADATRLPALATLIRDAQRAETLAQQDLTRRRGELALLTADRETLRAALANHAAQRESLTAQISTISGQRALALRDAETAQGLAAQHAQALAPNLKSLDEAGALADAGLATRLAARVAKVVALRSARETANAALIALSPQIASAASRAETATAQATEAQGATFTRQGALHALQTERAPLLNGEATAPHRTRHNEARKAALAALDRERVALADAASHASAAKARTEVAGTERHTAQQRFETAQAGLATLLTTTDLAIDDLAALLALPPSEVEALRQTLRTLDDAVTSARAMLATRQQDHAAALADGLPEEPAEALAETLAALDAASTARAQRIGAIDAECLRDATTRQGLAELVAEIAMARAELDIWAAVNFAAGSRNGDKFARVAQSITLDVLVDHANHHLADLNPRYRLRRAADLALQVEDRDMADEARATRSLSGGERFLVSLALALALSRMGGAGGGLASTLFIDEGFGSLDAASLDLAIDALESLQSQGRQVGVISHVEAMKDRIPTRIAVRKHGGGKSVVEIGGQHAGTPAVV